MRVDRPSCSSSFSGAALLDGVGVRERLPAMELLVFGFGSGLEAVTAVTYSNEQAAMREQQNRTNARDP